VKKALALARSAGRLPLGRSRRAQRERVRRIGVLMGVADDREGQARGFKN